MSLSPAYLKWREDTLHQGKQEGKQEGLNQGRQEGLQQGQRLVMENLLKVRFGNIDPPLENIIEPLLQLPSSESARLLIQLSREELLRQFDINNN